MQGRVHFYEGYAISDVVLPIRVMKKLGAEILFLTNSAGGLNTMYRPGDFMMITDQIASFMPSPLQGANVDEWGAVFLRWKIFMIPSFASASVSQRETVMCRFVKVCTYRCVDHSMNPQQKFVCVRQSVEMLLV